MTTLFNSFSVKDDAELWESCAFNEAWPCTHLVKMVFLSLKFLKRKIFALEMQLSVSDFVGRRWNKMQLVPFLCLSFGGFFPLTVREFLSLFHVAALPLLFSPRVFWGSRGAAAPGGLWRASPGRAGFTATGPCWDPWMMRGLALAIKGRLLCEY